ncbi:MAG TPA: hypothetical protein VGX95_07485 [Xanthobacteraceae bacterium]|jgi:hypothetical protein|nr:hypothetical protein [Xanthobacteraceae bacterium]
MMKTPAFVVAAVLASTLPAAPQALTQERPNPPVRVQVGLNIFVPGTFAGVDDPKLQQARRSLYELAGRECDLLRDAIAKDCRLESIQVNFNRHQQYPQQAEGFQANVSFNLQITPK